MKAAEPPARRLLAESLGTGFLLATVVGSGVMGANLAGGNVALALLGNTLPTGAMLVVRILIFGPVSGAHMNPAVSLAFALRRELSLRDLIGYVGAQLGGAVAGVWGAHLMFALPVWQISTHVRSGPSLWMSEGAATFGLVLTIFGCAARAPDAAPYAVGLYITAAYWFLHLVRQSGGYDLARALRHFRRDSAVERRGFHPRPAGRNGGGACAGSVALASRRCNSS